MPALTNSSWTALAEDERAPSPPGGTPSATCTDEHEPLYNADCEISGRENGARAQLRRGTDLLLQRCDPTCLLVRLSHQLQESLGHLVVEFTILLLCVYLLLPCALPCSGNNTLCLHSACQMSGRIATAVSLGLVRSASSRAWAACSSAFSVSMRWR